MEFGGWDGGGGGGGGGAVRPLGVRSSGWRVTDLQQPGVKGWAEGLSVVPSEWQHMAAGGQRWTELVADTDSVDVRFP